jgi:hypothetical protein
MPLFTTSFGLLWAYYLDNEAQIGFCLSPFFQGKMIDFFNIGSPPFFSARTPVSFNINLK